MRTITAHIQRVIASARRIWRELDYAQRRSFELLTGISVPPE
jgi:hypothetical protein